MLIAVWLILKVTFIGCGIFLIYALLKSFRGEDQETFVDGLKSALRDCGFMFRQGNYYSVELYKWVLNTDEEVCEESIERSDWPAMDIADWMKVGLPCSSEGETLCGQKCSCKLVLYKKIRTPSSKS